MNTAFAPAKVNLFLHVGPPDPDGMHPLCSLMVFADIGDTLTLEAADALSLRLTGPFSDGLDDGDGNLVMRGAKALLAKARGPQAPFGLLLDKQLPVAAGLGGGSSDAGAALRLVRGVLRPRPDDDVFEQVAASLGSDGAACLYGRPVLAEGLGERLSPAPAMPVLHAVLVNPGAASSTPAVYRQYDAMGAGGSADRPNLPDAFESAEELVSMMARLRNDLEAPAIALTPVIGEALELLRGEPESLLARVSGSGATCFALCAGDIEAEGLAERIERMRPQWWVRRCRLGGPWD